MSTLLDAHVKGSLPSGLPASTVLNPQAGIPTTLHPPQRTPLAPTNPLDTAPSSPQQIYLNLLILEASLRSQYLALTLRRRKYTFFFLLLLLWTLYFTHSIFIHGPSPYYYIYLLQKLALGAGVMTLAIFWLSGLHRKTLVFPRKFVGNTNKGLRQFNIKLVSVRLTLWERIVGWLVIFPAVKWFWPWCPALPYIPPGELEVEKGRSFGEVLRGFLKHGHHGPPNPAHAPPPPASMLTPGRKRRLSQASRMSTPPPDLLAFGTGPVSLGAGGGGGGGGGVGGALSDEEPLQPSGSHVKLVILPKGFSPDFREGWEIYRTDYWDKENERRAILRQQIRSHQSFLSRFLSPAPASIPTNYVSTISSPSSTSTPKPDRVHHLRDREHLLHHHHTSSTSSPRRVATPEPISRSATPDLLLLTPDGVLEETSTTSTTGSPRRPRRGSTASLNWPHRKSSIASIAGSASGGTGTPPPVMGPLTTLRSEILADEGDISDAGSIRSIAGSINDGSGLGGSKRRGSGKKTRGSKRGRGTKGESSRGGEGGGSTAGSAPGTPA